MPSLALTTFVKNEAPIVSGLFESVQGLVDEMVVIDTGSTDGTQDIARLWGAKLIEHELIDFAFIANFAMGHCTADWVLQLDADERMFRYAPIFDVRKEPEPVDMTVKGPPVHALPTHCRYEAVSTGEVVDQHQMFRDMIEDMTIQTWQFRRRNWMDWVMRRPMDDWREWMHEETNPAWLMRLIRRDSGMRYVRKAHPWVVDAERRAPEHIGMADPRGPYIDHFQFPAKQMKPGLMEYQDALCYHLWKADGDWGDTYGEQRPPPVDEETNAAIIEEVQRWSQSG